MGFLTGAVDCGSYVCSTNVDPGYSTTYFFSPSIRYFISRRIGIGVSLRLQFDTADASVRAQPLSNLLILRENVHRTEPTRFQS